MISKEQVEHIAHLARMELTEKEKEKFTKELSSILDYVEQLNSPRLFDKKGRGKVDTLKVEGVSQVTGLKDVMREDTRIKMRIKSELDANIRNKILKEAPKRKDNYFKVPKILE